MKDNRLPEKLQKEDMNKYFKRIFNDNCTSKFFKVKTGLDWDLPLIILSDKSPNYVRENLLDSVLGIYMPENNWLTEGRIVLYPENIQKASDDIALSSGIDADFAYVALTKIVLLHELGHWIHHWKLPTKGKSDCHYNDNFKNQSPELKEAIAQFYVWLAIHNEPQLLVVFDELLKDQNVLYHGHKELIKQITNSNYIIENYIRYYEKWKNVFTENNILNPSPLTDPQIVKLTELHNDDWNFNILKSYFNLTQKQIDDYLALISLKNLGF